MGVPRPPPRGGALSAPEARPAVPPEEGIGEVEATVCHRDHHRLAHVQMLLFLPQPTRVGGEARDEPATQELRRTVPTRSARTLAGPRGSHPCPSASSLQPGPAPLLPAPSQNRPGAQSPAPRSAQPSGGAGGRGRGRPGCPGPAAGRLRQWGGGRGGRTGPPRPRADPERARAPGCVYAGRAPTRPEVSVAIRCAIALRHLHLRARARRPVLGPWCGTCACFLWMS